MTVGLIKYRSLFLSDFHLGSLNCKAERLYWFLRTHTADRIYLVGDIFDGAFTRWPLYHDLALSVLMSHARKGAEIVYIPGNHDAFMRDHYGQYGSVRVARRARHACVDGRILLVTHGDETDCMPPGPWLNFLTAFERSTGISLWNGVRKFFSNWISSHVTAFEDKTRELALRRHDGVICGHIHQPLITETYMNCGDWTHHCTAIAEHEDGRFELLRG